MAETLQVRNLAQDPQNHALRRLRPGNRLGLLLGNGFRMRKKGVRSTEISVEDLVEHLEVLVNGVSGGYLEVTDSSGKVLSAEGLEALAGGKSAPTKVTTKEPAPAPTEPAPAPVAPAAKASPEEDETLASKPKAKKKGLFAGKDKE